MLRADLESPDKAALAYRDFVRAVVRRSVLEWKTFRPHDVGAMAIGTPHLPAGQDISRHPMCTTCTTAVTSTRAA